MGAPACSCAGRGLHGAQRPLPHRRSPPSQLEILPHWRVWHARSSALCRGSSAWQGVAPSGGSAAGPRGVREPGHPHRASRTSVTVRCGLPSATRPSAPPTAQRAPSRPVDAAVPKEQDRSTYWDVRTPSRCQAARICHSTERSIVGIATSGGSSMLPTQADCQPHQPERVSGRATAGQL